MTRWFKLTQSTTYEWKSKRSGKFYQFFGDKIVPVDDVGDQERFINLPDRFVEVDERGNVIDQSTGRTLPSSFSRKGMVRPRTYTKIVKSGVAEPPKQEAAPRTVVSGTKKAEPSAKKVPVAKPVHAETVPAEAEVEPEPEIVEDEAQDNPEGTGDAPDSSDGSDEASTDSVPKKRTKRSSKKKSGRKGD